MFCLSSISKRDELCPPSLDASDQRDSCGCSSPHHFPIFIFLRLSLANISLQYKLFRTRSRPMDTKALFSYFSKKMFACGYSLEAANSNVNDSFTPLRGFDDVDGREQGQKKTDDLRAMTTLGPRTLQYNCYMYHTGNSLRIRPVVLLGHTKQSAHQTCSPNIDIDICVHTYSPLRAFAV